MRKSCLNELKFCEVSRNFKSNKCWKFQISIKYWVGAIHNWNSTKTIWTHRRTPTTTFQLYGSYKNVEETYLKAIEIIFVRRGAQNAMKIQILGSNFVVANFKQIFGSFEVEILLKSFGIPQTLNLKKIEKYKSPF